MMNLSSIAPERTKTPSGIARAALKSAAPSPIRETLLLSRRTCTASHALVGGEALLRIESLFAVALPSLVEKGGGERWRWVLQPKPCAPCRKSGSGRQKEQCDASLQKGSALDHRQVQGQDVRALQKSDSSGRAGVLYPEDRSLYCGGDACGKAASREFSASSFDEENNTSM